MCQVPILEAPELFAEEISATQGDHCYVKRQPNTPEETARMLNVIRCAELECVRYRGTDPQIQVRLIELDCGTVCDHPLPELRGQFRKKKRDGSFSWMHGGLKRVLPQSRKRPWWKFWK